MSLAAASLRRVLAIAGWVPIVVLLTIVVIAETIAVALWPSRVVNAAQSAAVEDEQDERPRKAA
jgi:hypothetical protein